MPIRIQRKRTKGWTAPEGAIYVGRGSRWGNPYEVHQDPHEGDWWVSCGGYHDGPFPSKADAIVRAVELHRQDITTPGPHHSRLVDPAPTPADVWKTLRGRDLMCWCAPGLPCHADTLLEIANGPTPAF